MTFAAADYGVAYSRMTTIELQRRSMFMNLVNRAHETELLAAGNYSTVIQDITFGSIGNVTEGTDISAFNADWGTPNQLAASQITLKLDRELRQNDAIRHYDVGAVPFPTIERIRSMQAIKMSRALDDGISAYMTSLATSGKATQDDGSGANGNAGPVKDFGTVGSSSDALGGNTKLATFGIPTGNKYAELGEEIFDFLQQVRLWAENTYVYNGQTLGGDPGALWCVMRAEAFVALAKDLTTERIEYDPAAMSLFQPGTPTVFAPGGDRRYRGRVADVDIITEPSPNLIPVQTNDTTRAGGFPVVVGTNMAVTAAVAPMIVSILDPTTNQTKPQFEFRQFCYWTRGLVNSALIGLAKIASYKGS